MSTAQTERRFVGGRLWALLPVVLLTTIVGLFAATGGSVVGLLGDSPPQPDEFDIRRVEFSPGEIRIRVTNPQRDELTIASVTVDDAVVPFELDGPQSLGRLRSATIVVAHDWVEDDPIAVGVTSSSGIETTQEVAAAVETPGVSARSIFGYGLIGFFVGIVPVALGLGWLPSLRRAAPHWLAAFMAVTAGLLVFLGLEALTEAFELQAALPSALGGAGLVLLGVSVTFLALTVLSHRLGSGGSGGPGRVVTGASLALLVAVGIGLHNLGEGLAIGSSFALGELALGSFFVIGFMIHNVTEGLGIAAPLAERGGTASLRRLVVLAVIAGGPAILGAWLGGYVTSDLLGVLFFAGAAGAAFEVVVEVGRYLSARSPGGLGSPYVMGGFLAGLATMYITGLLVA